MKNKSIWLALALLLFVLAVAIISSGCANSNYGDSLSYQYDYALITIGNENVLTIGIRSWKIYTDTNQIQIWGTDGKMYLCYANNVTLINGNPPMEVHNKIGKG